MQIAEAQREVRTRFVGGFYGQLVSGLLWLVSAGLATWGSPRSAITILVMGGFFIFPATELLPRVTRRRVVIALYWPRDFSIGAWYAGAMLLLFAAVGRATAQQEIRAEMAQ